ncbi:hypothetical protein [Kurthia senegalensis]|uniref:hypothetical protein n=1 Tax=Kurthia senegalensis TaxID=1033740 RepID=UPI00028987CF|nr:hypothetical protein [Kurthia senegalensis]
MNLFFLCLSTLIVLYIAGNAYYIAFKRYDEEDDFTFNGFTTIEFIFDMLLVIAEKISPQSIYIYVFKVFSFLFGSIFLSAGILLWMLFY